MKRKTHFEQVSKHPSNKIFDSKNLFEAKAATYFLKISRIKISLTNS